MAWGQGPAEGKLGTGDLGQGGQGTGGSKLGRENWGRELELGCMLNLKSLIKAYRWLSDEADLQLCRTSTHRLFSFKELQPPPSELPIKVADTPLCLDSIYYSPSDEPCLKLHLQKRRGILEADCRLQTRNSATVPAKPLQ